MDTQLREYIIQSRQLGKPDNLTVAELKQAGWSDTDITNVISEIDYQPLQTKIESQKSVAIEAIRYFRKPIIIGALIAVLVLCTDIFVFQGMLGVVMYMPLHAIIRPLFSVIVKLFIVDMPGGDAGLGVASFLSHVVFFVTAILFSLFINLNFKHFLKKQRNQYTRYVHIFNVFFVSIIIYSLGSTAVGICLENSSCIMRSIDMTGQSSICEHARANTRFEYNTKANTDLYVGYIDTSPEGYYGKGGCYTNLAVLKKDESYCKSLTENDRSICYSYLSRVIVPTAEHCDEIKSNHRLSKDICNLKVAIQSRDPSRCNLIQFPSGYQIFTCLAGSKNDSGYCRYIQASETGANRRCFDVLNSSPSDTDTRKIYKNSTYSFEIRYPADFEIKEVDNLFNGVAIKAIYIFEPRKDGKNDPETDSWMKIYEIRSLNDLLTGSLGFKANSLGYGTVSRGSQTFRWYQTSDANWNNEIYFLPSKNLVFITKDHGAMLSTLTLE